MMKSCAGADPDGDRVFSPQGPDRYRGLLDSLINFGDHYPGSGQITRSYVDCQDRVDALYRTPEEWTAKTMHNITNMGYFSSDRTVREYAQKIWYIDKTQLRPFTPPGAPGKGAPSVSDPAGTH